MSSSTSSVAPAAATAAPTRSSLVVPALGAVYFIWGSTYLAMRVAVAGLPPFFMASTRFILTGLVLLAILKARGAAWPTRREWLFSTPVGVLMFVLGNGTVAVAEQRISSGVAAVVCGTMPLWVGAMAPLFGEKATPREWLGLVLGFVGVAVLSLGGELRAHPFYAAILFVAPVSWALGSLLARKLPLAKGLMSAATQMLTGGLVMGVVSLVAGERVPTAPPASAVVAWIYLAIFGSLVAYSAYTWLLRNTRPAVATSYSYVNPVIAVLLGAVLGSEQVGPEVIVAVALVVVATVLVVVRRAR
ncbi:MAG: drug/metabolite exporter YedA [Myxococcota bacterium]